MKKLYALALLAFVLVPTIAFGAFFDSNLSYGVTTSKVADLQQFLTDQGLYTGPITSTFGPMTLKALISYQQKMGITPAVGYFGPTTRMYANAYFDRPGTKITKREHVK
jgi:peptidoglycan hydrolase-like protein with peptidoglycan-binding domain